jgi:hypothetical protein
MDGTTYAGGNFLLDRLGEDFAGLKSELEMVALGSGEVLYPGGAEEELAFVWFPTDAVTSMLTVMSDGSAVEAGSVGCEGVVGSQTAFGSARIIERWICQVPGDSARLPASAFRRAYQAQATLRIVIDRYTQAYMASLSQSVACNRLHTLYERCARWLLLTHDRVGRDDFLLTQEFLSIMLGVRRPGVSVAAATLARAGFISYVRGNVRVLDRPGLESASCECYAVVTREYQRLFQSIADQTLVGAPGE